MDQNLKEQLVERCRAALTEKVSLTKQAMEAAQEAANAEGKSSVGDKYETTRAQMQAERDRYARQLAEAQKHAQVFESLQFTQTYSDVQAGSLAVTSLGNFLIAVSLGEINLGKEKAMVISPLSPIGQELLQKKINDSFSFRGRQLKVLNIL